MSKKAVVLCSGGLDSTTCLAVAQNQGYDIYALSFDYGQRNKAELQAVERQAKQFNAKQHMIQPLNLRTMGHSALTDDSIDVPEYSGDGKIPATYVPARNTMFLSIALGWAEVLDADAIYIGVSHVDFSGYPDCRPEYIAAFQTMANLATKRGVEGNPIKIITPIIDLSKADTIKLGLSLDVDYSQTVTCYSATENGEACGRCDSCVLRKQGFEQAEVADPTRYV
ncbi:MAG: 7-cyano-7-deazaguanine synthase QueC [Coxiellaceae bacterium]|nr:7-cyano-7-deazaguanine synthase QueC [Coxiellaceae bacterium]